MKLLNWCKKHRYKAVQQEWLLYTLPHSAMEPLVCQFKCSISECTNDLLHSQFAMQTYVLHQVDVASELLHSWWFAHAQSNNKTINVWLFMKHWICLHSLPVSLIKIEHLAFGLVFYFCQLNRTFVHTNPLLHAEPYINYYLLPTHMHHYNSLLLLHGWHQRHRWSRRGSDSELLRSQKIDCFLC